MLEYINGILNTGDVQNLYAQQADKDDIINAVRAEVMNKYGNLMESNVMKVYLSRVLKHIHVVLSIVIIFVACCANISFKNVCLFIN